MRVIFFIFLFFGPAFAQDQVTIDLTRQILAERMQTLESLYLESVQTSGEQTLAQPPRSLNLAECVEWLVSVRESPTYLSLIEFRLREASNLNTKNF